MQTIHEVIYTLDDICSQCKKNQDKAGYFAALYKRMTQAVADGMANNQFEDSARMERLDVLFASRYINAYQSYQSNLPVTQSWRFVFDNCKMNNLVVLQQLLLGINTHINLDLAIAAAETAPGAQIVNLQKDFFTINKVIEALVDDVQECLSQVWLPMRLIAKVVGNQHTSVLNFSIDKARLASWSNANLLANLPTNGQAAYIEKMDSVVLGLGQKITQPGFMMKYILNLVRKTEYNNVANTIQLIEDTMVNA